MWHLSVFQPSEIIEIAVAIEKKGEELYKALAERAATDELKETLMYLAGEEGKHQATFLELGEEFNKANLAEQYPGEYLDYVGSLLENHLFNNQADALRLLESSPSKLDIIKLALTFEKDTLLLFSALRNLVKEDKKKVIDDLIMEEQIHIIKLNRLKKEV